MHVLLVSPFDQAISWLICTLTNLFLSGQKRIGHSFLTDQLFSTFFSHSLKLGYSKIADLVMQINFFQDLDHPNVRE